MSNPVFYKVIYNNKDITADISNMLISLVYTDKVAGESDELEITVEDKEGIWKNEWYPDIGATIQAQIIHGNDILDCGLFELDETEGRGSKMGGDSFTIKCLAAGIKDAVRSRKSYAHENKTLREIANTIAAQYGYTVTGIIDNVRLERVTQYRETDLSFLSKLSFEYGYVFSVRNKQLIFSKASDLEAAGSVYTLRRIDLLDYDIKDKTSDTFLQANTAYYHPKAKRLIEYTSRDNRDIKFRRSFDYIEVRTKSENVQQAELKSAAALHWANSKQQEGNVSVEGNMLIVAGNNISLLELGNYSGVFHVMSSRHRCERGGGYITSCEIKRIGLVTAEQQKQAN